MDNGQTKEQPMTDEAMKAMARRIADEASPRSNPQDALEAALNGAAYRAALAAISETQERCAALAEDRYLETDWQEPGQHIAAAIRSGQQFRKDV